MTTMEKIEQAGLTQRTLTFNPGDTIRVMVSIKEGDKERAQAFEGTVIRIRRGANRTTFTVRKVSYGVGVERIFPLHTPSIQSISVVSRAKVRRAKLYYLRNLRGKAAVLKEYRRSAEG